MQIRKQKELEIVFPKSLHGKQKSSSNMIHRSASFIAMPPPLPKVSNDDNVTPSSTVYSSMLEKNNTDSSMYPNGLDLLCQAVVSEHITEDRHHNVAVVVSPDITFKYYSPDQTLHIPEFELGGSINNHIIHHLHHHNDFESSSDNSYNGDDHNSGFVDADNEDDDDEIVSFLSLDQCADIIDTCLIFLNPSSLSLSSSSLPFLKPTINDDENKQKRYRSCSNSYFYDHSVQEEQLTYNQQHKRCKLH